jgi:tetratricopeptide (TPR) repeat protein/tRNA A-37 threonylcarbamoyl transferase component Bud32
MSEASKPALSNTTRRADQIAEVEHVLDSDCESGCDDAADKTPVFPNSPNIRCPKCHGLTAIAADQPLGQIRCTSCGSQLARQGEEIISASSSTSSTIICGQCIGRFELIERIGSGGFGEVWKARDTQLDRTVAVKIPHRSQLAPEEIEKVLREARAAAQLRHPNIVSVHEAWLEGQRVYIVADFIEGQSLDKWMAGRRVAYRDSAALCIKIADGLHHAHECGVIHRDLKPGNIMIDLSGEPHIMDFGLAKREAGETTLTMDGQILGTPAYMSPEQAKGLAHAADRRTDVYSLGVILFELLTGERPFRGSLQMLLKQVMQDDPVSPRKLDGRVPRDLETICLKCLQKEPARRYPTANAFSEELGRYMAGKPIQARPISALERMGRWCGRNRLVAGSALVAVLCLSFGLVTATVGYVRTSRALEKSEQSRRMERKAIDEGRKLIDDWYTQMSEETLLKEPGMQRIRKVLLLRARDYYEKFLALSGGDDTIRDELAQAHFRVGWITEEIESAAKAISSYEIAGGMQKQLLQSDQNNIERLKTLGDTYNAMGRALQLQQQLERALETYQKAIDVRSRLTALSPAERESNRMLANTYMNVGLLEMRRGSYDEARRRLEQAQAIRLQPQIAGNDPKLRRDIAMGYYNLANLSLAGLVQADKNHSSAREWCNLGRQWSRQAATLFQVLAESDRADLEMRYLLAICYRMEADLACAEAASCLEPGEDCDKKRINAKAIYQKSLDILEPLARKNPDVTEYHLALAELYGNIAHVCYEQENLDTAMASIDQAEAILTSLAADCGDTARYWKVFTGTWSFIGEHHTDSLRRRKALTTLETWQKYLEQVAAKAPDDVGVQEPLQRTRGAIEIIKKSDAETEKSAP